MRPLLAALLALLAATSAGAQAGMLAPTLEAEVTPPFYGSTDYGRFGELVALDGDHAAVSANDNTGTRRVGVVHTLRRSTTGWVVRQALAPSDPDAPGTFGATMALNGDVLVVGSPTNVFATVPGGVYVYSFDGTEWKQTALIAPPSSLPSRRGFGSALDFDGRRLVVGAPGSQNDAGSAYVYERVGGVWTLTATLTSPFAGATQFGYDVALDGGLAVVSERSDVFASRINTFELGTTGWTWTADLISVGGSGGLFQSSVDVSGGRVVVGAPRVSGGFGEVYVFERQSDTWARTAVLVDGVDGNSTNRLGTSVSLDGDRMLVGASSRVLSFRFDGAQWLREAPLVAGGSGRYMFVGIGDVVALDGLHALAGSPDTGVEGSSRAGAVFAFDLVVAPTPDTTRWEQASTIDLGPQRAGHAFGSAVALDGGRLAVGAPGNGRVSGSAYVFSTVSGQPTFEARFAGPADGTYGVAGPADGTYGVAVALGSDVLLVGAPGLAEPGRVFVYTRKTSGWELAQTLTGAGFFGRSLSLDGDRVLVGAPGRGADPGRAALYERTAGTWALVTELHPTIPATGNSFGTSVALDGARVVVGAPYTQANPSSYGLAYVFEQDGDEWERVATLSSGAPGPNGLFGASVSLSGGRTLVGVPSAPAGGGVNGGRAAVYEGLSWALTASFTGTGPESTFGARVALDGNRAVVGASLDDGGRGQAFLYGFDGITWARTAELASPGALDGERYGTAIAVEGRRFAVGAPYPGGLEFGAVYLYRDQVTVAGETGPLADAPRLFAPRPNPASSMSRLVLSLGQPETVTATVYDALGRAVQALLTGERVLGELTLTVDAGALAPGLYVVRVVGETFAESARLVVTR